MDEMDGERSGERGQVIPLLLAVLAVLMLVLLGVARLGVAVHDRARAHLAADAAALAGAADGRDAAARTAAANGARLVQFRPLDRDVIVTVVLHDMRATARARAVPAGVTSR
jgi:hypothetical protein